MDESKRRMLEGWIDKASNQLQVAREHLKSYTRYSEAIEASQECIELSIKAILSLLNIKYPRKHKWNREEFSSIATQIQKRQLLGRLAAHNLAHIRLPRLLFLANFWAEFYLPAKYGLDYNHLAPARDLFDMKEAELAVQHAEECYRAASELRYLSEDQLVALSRKETEASGVSTSVFQ